MIADFSDCGHNGAARQPIRAGLLLVMAFLIIANPLHKGASADSLPENPVLVTGLHSKALDLSGHSRYIEIDLGGGFAQRPVTIAVRMRINSTRTHNILVASEPKTHAAHWELYTMPDSGTLGIYAPQVGDFRTDAKLKVGEWHFIAVRFFDAGLELYLDGRRILRRNFNRNLVLSTSPLLIGRLPSRTLPCDGAIDELAISHGGMAIDGFVPDRPQEPQPAMAALFHFDTVIRDLKGRRTIPNLADNGSVVTAVIHDELDAPIGERFLDEVQREQYAQAKLFGDAQVEYDSTLPVNKVEAEPTELPYIANPPARLDLDGSWLMKGCKSRLEAGLEPLRTKPKESVGTQQHWFAYGHDRSDWFEVTVPTSVQSALLKRGQTSEPDAQTPTIQWDSPTFQAVKLGVRITINENHK